jgi:hypothetical protein
VWLERDGAVPPVALPHLPSSWPGRYERLAVDHHVQTDSFAAAAALVARLWEDMFAPKET